MNIIIAEDEYAARKNLLAILEEVCPDCNILAVFESVQEAADWIGKNPSPEMAFFDIQLSDNNIFQLFKIVDVKFPVVFVTAYGHYAIKAFKVNSIDYILKPVSTEAISFAIKKYNEMLELGKEAMNDKVNTLIEEVRQISNKTLKKTFLAQYKDKLIPVPINEIAYFYIENGIVYLTTTSKKSYTINQNLDDIIDSVDPESYFRANRQFIISKKAIKEIIPYFNERLSLSVDPKPPQTVIISKANASQFKDWMRL